MNSQLLSVSDNTWIDPYEVVAIEGDLVTRDDQEVGQPHRMHTLVTMRSGARVRVDLPPNYVYDRIQGLVGNQRYPFGS